MSIHMQQNDSLNEVISLIAKLPNLGMRSARKISLHLLQNKELLSRLSDALKKTAEDMIFCHICMNIDTCSPCSICASPSRDQSIICVVEGIGDLWALERGGLYNGLYHVLGGTLSAIHGKTPETLNFDQFKKRLQNGTAVKEVIIATNATLDGESTSHYIASLVEALDIKATRIAHGIPMGGELDHMDDGTLKMAFKLRHIF